MTLNWQQAIGLEQQHLVEFVQSITTANKTPSHLIHKNIETDLQKLFTAAKNDGVEIAIVSSYRSFEQQLNIWNAKWLGNRAIYNKDNQKLSVSKLTNPEKLHAISLWSALPGMSRHHWGTDIDIFSTAAITQGYQVKLIPQEFSKKGICKPLNDWLEANLEQYGFFRPYKKYQQGISEEPWHISHRLVSQKTYNNFPYERCINTLKESKIESKVFINEQFELYKKQYFENICL